MSVATDGLDLVTRQRRALEALRAGVPSPGTRSRRSAAGRRRSRTGSWRWSSGPGTVPLGGHAARRRVRLRQEPPPGAPWPARPERRPRGQPRRDQQGDPAARPGQGLPGRGGQRGRRRPARHSNRRGGRRARPRRAGVRRAAELGRLAGERPERAVRSLACCCSPGCATETRSTPMRSSASGPATRCRPRSCAGG